MGDLSAEPSMEEILSSIKRIIAEEGDTASPARPRRPRATAAEPMARDGDPEDVLELSEPAPPAPEPVASAEPALAPAQPAAPAVQPTPSIVSPQAADATRGALEALSRLVVKPETAGSDTLEGLVREMLRPMLRDWLDAHLPQMVETMVAREIARIASGAR